jgi:hypothetical protein
MQQKKRNSSQVWQAILKGRTVLELGLARRIGDGHNQPTSGRTAGSQAFLGANQLARREVQQQQRF